MDVTKKPAPEVWEAIETRVYFGDGGIDLRNVPKAEARARLIAAAPEMYEALAYVIRDLEMRADLKLGSDKGLVDIGNGAYTQAVAALRKARGEA